MKDYFPAKKSAGTMPFTEDEIANIPEEVRVKVVNIARVRFPMQYRMVANAMIGMLAIYLKAQVPPPASKV